MANAGYQINGLVVCGAITNTKIVADRWKEIKLNVEMFFYSLKFKGAAICCRGVKGRVYV